MKKFSAFILGLFLTVPALADLIGETAKGTTDYSVELTIIDSTDGTRETGVVFNTAGIDLWYRREGGLSVDITEADLATPALDDAHADGGFLHINDGVYRLDLPDAAVATGADWVSVGGTVTGMIVIGGRVKLTDVDMNDSVRGGMAALPDAAADAAGGLPISDAGGLDLDAVLSGNTPQTGDSFARLGAPAGASVSADIASIEAQTDDIGAAGAGLTAVPWNSAWDTEVQSEANDALVANHLDHLLAADYDPASPPGVSTALLNELIESDGGVSRYTVNALENAPSGSGASAETIADAVWDEDLTGHQTSGTAGAALGDGDNGSGLSAVPWNSAWDAEVQSEAADALTAYDAVVPADLPTNFADLDIEATTGHVDVGYWNGTEITTALENSSDIADAVWDEAMSGHTTAGTAGDALGVDVPAILVDTAEIGAGGAGLDSIPWNSSWDAEVQSEAADALVANHLDHLLAADYDPASPPGVSTALLNELIESDGGVSRYTVNALENAPSGSGASAETIADAVWDEAQADHVTAGTFGITASEIASILVDTAEIGAAGAGLTEAGGTGDQLTALATAAALGTAQSDLDTITGSDGVTLATTQGNYAPSTAASLSTAQADLDILTGSDGVTLATSQPNYTPATAAALSTHDGKLDTVDANVDVLRRAVGQQDTTIATLASQVSFTLTGGSSDDDAYNGCGITITDQGSILQFAFAGVQDYVGSTRTVTLDADPGIFTMATGDLVTITCHAVNVEFMNKSEVLGTGASGDPWTGN